MYIDKNKRLLSSALLFSALISLFCGGLNLLSRFILRNFISFRPDMLNKRVWIATGIVSFIQICLTSGIFLHYHRLITRYILTVPEEDRKQLGLLTLAFYLRKRYVGV